MEDKKDLVDILGEDQNLEVEAHQVTSLDEALGEFARPESMKTDDTAMVEVEEKAKLSPEEQALVDKVKNKINLKDSTSIAQYGLETQKGLTDFADTVLKNVKIKDTGSTGADIQNLVNMMKDADEASQGANAITRFFNRGKRSIENLMTRYNSISTEIDKIEAQLIQSKDSLIKDNHALDTLYDQNLQYFKAVQVYIEAGEQKINEISAQIPAWLAEAQERDDARGGSMYVQGVKDIQDSIVRFEKRLADLKTTKIVAIQQAPQIRMIQNSNNLLIDKINSTTTNTISLWKSQIIIALGLENQTTALEAQRASSEYTNELLRSNAEKLQQTTTDIARASEETVIEVDTLKEVNQRLIDTLNETLQIQEEGRQKRQEAEVELANIEQELGQALYNLARGSQAPAAPSEEQ